MPDGFCRRCRPVCPRWSGQTARDRSKPLDRLYAVKIEWFSPQLPRLSPGSWRPGSRRRPPRRPRRRIYAAWIGRIPSPLITAPWLFRPFCLRRLCRRPSALLRASCRYSLSTLFSTLMASFVTTSTVNPIRLCRFSKILVSATGTATRCRRRRAASRETVARWRRATTRRRRVSRYVASGEDPSLTCE